MLPDGPFWEWKFGEVSLVLSAILIALARPFWFSIRFLVYALFASALSWRWVVQCCVRLWHWTDWDIGSAIFGMVEHRWSVHSPGGTPAKRSVIVGVNYSGESESESRKFTDTIKIPDHVGVAGDTIDLSYANVNSIDKREHYRQLFSSEVIKMLERRNARQLQMQSHEMIHGGRVSTSVWRLRNSAALRTLICVYKVASIHSLRRLSSVARRLLCRIRRLARFPHH